jgi:hypothetical protein
MSAPARDSRRPALAGSAQEPAAPRVSLDTPVLVSRRTALLLTATSLAGLTSAACRAARQREPWATGPRLRNGHPVLRLPFPAGTAVLCQQGNLSPSWRTHFKENCRHAIDFSNTSVASLDVVAAAPGRVGHVYDGSAPDDKKAGFGFGNQVKVDHGGSYFTMYAHLDQVSVKVGDIVDNAARLGTVGWTGAAGNRHLHFSLHQGSPTGMGVYETIAMDALVTAELPPAAGFRAASSTDLRDGRSNLWDGALYGSENEAGKLPLAGAPPPELSALLEASRERLERALHDRVDLDTVALDWERRDPAWARALVSPVLVRSPGHAVARYWLATAVLLASGKRDEAEAALRDLLSSGPVESTWEPWLVSWAHNRLGVIAMDKGQKGEARSHFAEGLRTATAIPERRFAAEHLGSLPPEPDGGI